MVLTSVVFIILASLCGVRDVHADTNLAAFSRKLNMLDRTTQAWKGTFADLGTEMSNNFDLLKEELTGTFIPALIKPLVKQAITGILKEEYVGNIISGRVLAVVTSLKTRVHNTKTQLRSVKRKIRQVKRERDSYKESLGKLRGELTKDIHRNFQGIQQRELEERDALREKPIQDLTEQNQKASIDQSRDRSNREKAAQMTTVTTNASSDPSRTERTQVATTEKPATQASIDQSRDRSNREKAAQMTTVTTNASSDPSRTERTPVATTKKPATQATPSPADCSRLIDASWRGELDEVKRLLSLGVDVNCRGWRNWTPLMWAAGYGNSDVVQLLVSKGADVSLVDVVGVNILHFAGWGGDLETVKFVLSLNVVDIDARDKEGKTAADYARSNRYPRVVDLLESRGAQ
ncbi:protein HOS4-like isoform X2 [Haliotis rufescens]|uniref:protein HOS4-like isoform X2 n=1 Tax=Haliotis rufescens TaxID=6454 RepID=UPI00201F2853|nr:protein HOS4-like isoform X2 [Haliotis rufescens]